MRIIEGLTVYKNEFGFSTLLKNKEDKMYMAVGFKKNCEPKNEVNKIDITNGFLSFYKDRNGFPKPKIMVLDYVVQEEQGDAYEDPFATVVSDDGLPF